VGREIRARNGDENWRALQDRMRLAAVNAWAIGTANCGPFIVGAGRWAPGRSLSRIGRA
jgi:hypothetical protein